MFASVYVILPVSDLAPAEAIRASLAPFQRGGKGDVPDDWLAFHDETAEVRTIHLTEFIFTREEGRGTRIEGEPHWHLDIGAINDEMARRGLQRWQVRFTDFEPDLDAFVKAYVRDMDRHPATGGYGRWLNPLGRWDWWDLGGRFDGRIIGERRRPGVRRTASVSSGPDTGRTILVNVTGVLADALGSEPPEEVVVEADANIEMVSRLAEDGQAGVTSAFPGAILLPPGAVDDRLRWLQAWPRIEPEETISWLGLPNGADWGAIVSAAYRRFPEHWAAGVAYHL
ncbi:hypothetical protein FV222_08225 [Methylobacterium sp. WL103]|uniref:hypothetical protein n=1 Tax=Methylobacterium sp. WL103 TaxID=2603891 RepID=UPI0011C8BDAA|nr:hypothetical protein [Methylobacterium sp. WL103]TXN03744.1 hypothetical protein FV222_08225 [Methylobacterium sp. WL103]